MYKLSFADEQGLVSCILQNEEHIMISTSKLGILHHDNYFDGKQYVNYEKINLCHFDGFHFVGINRRKHHSGYLNYLKYSKKLL